MIPSWSLPDQAIRSSLPDSNTDSTMKTPAFRALAALLVAIGAMTSGCNSSDETMATDAMESDGTLHAAFAEFDTDNMTVLLDGDEVVIETNGLPNHTSPYWSSTNSRPGTTTASEDHPLWVAPTETSYDRMAPGDIDRFIGSYSLTVPVSPQKASNTSATGLGAIGLAVSGSVIYNDQEGPNVPLDNAASSLDFSGAHTGPQSYHYHLEPTAWSQDDSALIGIISDGFFLYGRRDADGSHPSDLDASGGHTGPTPHNPDGEYHYHIQNELYLGQYYILFPGDYQGTPNSIR